VRGRIYRSIGLSAEYIFVSIRRTLPMGFAPLSEHLAVDTKTICQNDGSSPPYI
jgi:hypothetical protein